MKKISFAIAACAIFAFAACGGAKTTENNTNTDSIRKDSIAKAEAAAKAKDSADKAAAEASKKDSADKAGKGKEATKKP
jgi:hypothetical protein